MTVAIYLRLSNEDTDLKNSDKNESESISNQRCLLYDYIAARPEFTGAEIIEFCDDGWSGKNFERPAMKEMLEQIKAGRIQCVCVKDLSRFGRDYLTVGDYISRVFPFLGVRFIAVNDGFDSIRPQDTDSLETSFKALIYDLYSRDLSEKTKSAKRQRAEQGLYVSAFAPYGYRKNPENKNRLLIDEEAAKVVRRIFQGIADGKSTFDIASELNAEGIPTTMQHKRNTSYPNTRWNAVHDENFWTTKAITRILRDEQYLGRTVYGKRKKTEIAGSRSEAVNKSDWIVAENRHEAIVSQELFDLVQEKLGNERKSTSSNKKIPRRKIYCGSCGLAMDRSDSKSHNYLCRNRNLNTGYDCPTEGIPEQDIQDAVLTAIRTYARLAVDLEELNRQQEEKRQIERRKIIQQITVLQSEKRRNEGLLQDLYEGFVDAKFTKERYLPEKKKLSERMREIADSIRSLEEMLREQTPDKDPSGILRHCAEYAQIDKLTLTIYLDLVERIDIHKNGRIEVKLNFSDDILRLADELHAPEVAKTAVPGGF